MFFPALQFFDNPYICHLSDCLFISFSNHCVRDKHYTYINIIYMILFPKFTFTCTHLCTVWLRCRLVHVYEVCHEVVVWIAGMQSQFSEQLSYGGDGVTFKKQSTFISNKDSLCADKQNTVFPIQTFFSVFKSVSLQSVADIHTHGHPFFNIYKFVDRYFWTYTVATEI